MGDLSKCIQDLSNDGRHSFFLIIKWKITKIRILFSISHQSVSVWAKVAKEQRERERKTRDFSPSLIRDLWQRVLVDKTKNLDGTRERKKERKRQDIPSNDHFKSPASVCLSLLSDALNNAIHVGKSLKGSPGKSCAATQETVSKFLLQQQQQQQFLL